MEQQNIQFVRQLLPNVQELAKIIRDTTSAVTVDDLWRATLGRFAVTSGGWEVWWPNYEPLEQPFGGIGIRLFAEAGYRGSTSSGPLRRMVGMRLTHAYEAAYMVDPSDAKAGLAWFAGVVEKSFWEVRQKILETEDRCLMEEARSIQAMSPDGVDMQAGKYLAGQISAGQMNASQLQPGNALNNALGALNNGLGNYTYGKTSQFAYLQEEPRIGQTGGAWQEEIRREMEALRKAEEKKWRQAAMREAEEQARRAYFGMTGIWPPEEKAQEETSLEKQQEAIRITIERMRAAGLIGGPSQSQARGTPPAPPEDMPDLTKPAKRKILVIED
jgi:hypothetical protein